MHVYVLNEDEQGKRYVLFPHRVGKLQNPLPAAVRHRLPGVVGTLDVNWEVSSAGGKDWIFVVASSRRQAALEEAALRERLSGERPVAGYAQLDDKGIRPLLRGIGALTPRQEEEVASGKALLAERIEELQQAVGKNEAAEGLWSRKFTLQNP